MIKRLFSAAALALSFASVVDAQSSSGRLLELDPNIVAAANCNGALLAVSMFNFENDILNEERARVMMRTTSLAFFLMGIKHQSVQHIAEYAEDYDSFFVESYEAVYDDLRDGNFSWESQAEIDICSARIFEPLTSVTEQELARSGVADYFKLRARIAAEADKRFDYMLRMMEAMR
jgi:hypothetical protein